VCENEDVTQYNTMHTTAQPQHDGGKAILELSKKDSPMRWRASCWFAWVHFFACV